MPLDPGLDDLPRLLRGLEDVEDPVLRMTSARAIGRLGPSAASATEALARRLADDDPMVRAMSAAAIGKVGRAAGAAIPRLRRALEDPVVPVLFWVLDALGRMGADADDALPAIEARLDHAHESVRNAARLAVERIRRARASSGGGDEGIG